MLSTSISGIKHIKMNPDFAQAVAGYSGASIAFLGTRLASSIPPESPIPQWIFEGGAWVTMTVLLIYAIVHQHKEYKALQTLRENDRRDMLSQWEKEHDRNRKSQDDLKDSVQDLASVIRERLPKQ